MEQLAHVKLTTLIACARADGVPPERFRIRDAFADLGERSSDRGGGPLDASDLCFVGEVVPNPTLAEIISVGEKVAARHYRPVTDLLVGLIALGGEVAFSVLSPQALN